ncbi:hypothetical protein BC938DRAFT_470993, partial [Jimgerdemannia flammicorona]
CEKARSEDIENLITTVTTLENLVLKYVKNIQIKYVVLKCLQLREFTYSDSHIDDKGASEIAEVLKTNTSLKTLDLCGR